MPIESTTERRLLQALVTEEDRDVRHLLAGLLDVDPTPADTASTDPDAGSPALDLTTARARAEARWRRHDGDPADPRDPA